ncbi:Hsp20/alpha crystallin family protein [Desulfobacterota bacterium AH_259_B03_O07]|nr:Hsp20/alpha crystallin family protein [Desulfobacterota bacterium AH_259_B03_O07]
MALMKWTPSKEMERLFGEFVDDPFLTGFRRRLPMWKSFREFEGISPAVDMIDKKDEIVVKAEVPGVEKNDINISLTDSTLTIKGETKKEKETKDEDYYYSERTYGSFARTLSLPEKVQADNVKANFKNGILEIHLPKAPEAKHKEIKVDVE